jgi:glutamyl-tRNA synthetase
MAEIRVRFAPSPTGFLHVGGARTAIFNWLYARRHGGTFVLRIEDTDRQRSSDEMTEAILEGMRWLGLTADEGPYYQSQGKPTHVEAANRLLDSGHAYRCFCSAETIRAEREAAEKSGEGYRYPRTCAALDPAESTRRAAAGEPFAVRCRVPHERIEWDDLVHGPTGFDGSLIEDFVILRSDGSPTYMLSVVTDDLEMEISHVIRGDDHLSNTPKQIVLYRALGHRPPTFAHLPLILGDDKKRLSKRHGAVSVLAYREQGYLPQAMLNFLALLGWSPGDDRQKMTLDELIAAFDLDGVGKSPAVFDLQKLEWLNGQYLDEQPTESLVPAVREQLVAAGLWDGAFDGERRRWLLELLELLKPRCRKLTDFVEQGRPYLEPGDAVEYEAKARKKHVKEGTRDLLKELRGRLAALEEWEADPLERTLRELADSRQVSAGKLIHPTRLAVTGRGASPGLFEVLVLLGRDRTLGRMDRLIADLNGGGPTGMNDG